VVGNLKTAFADLKNQSSFNSITPGNSQPTALSVVASTKAATGSHTVSVTSLAASQRNISAGFATAGTSMNGGVAFSLSLSVHGAPAKPIAVTEATPEGVVAAINKAALGVTAELVNTGDATAPFKIMVKGSTGVANDFTLKSDVGNSGITATTTQGSTGVNETSALAFGTALTAGQTVTVGGLTYTSTGNTSTTELAAAFASLRNGATTGPSTALGAYTGTLSGFSTGPATNSTVVADSPTTGDVTDIQISGAGVTGLEFGTVLQTVASAALTVNGVAVTSSTNSIEGAISGVTLNLSTVTTTPLTLSFSRDTTSVKAKLEALVASYNDAVSMLNVVSDPKSTVETYGATLVGNSTVLSVRNQMRAMIMGDSSSPAGGITALRDLGISIDRTGVLQLDAAKLDVALTTKFDSVVTMLSSNRENQSTFSTLSAGVAGDSVKKLTALLDATGSLTTQNTNAAAKISAYNKELAKLETRLATILARYNKQLTAMDSIVGQTNSMRTGLTATFDGMMAAYTNK
jgi:flagellar hook-associated protein 2